MRVFMIGGTGLLGSEAARELIARGHQVVSIALPPLPEGAQALGVTGDDPDGAIGNSILLCRDILDHKTEAVGMRGE